MSEDSLEQEVLSHVGMDRRSFIRKLLVGTAFAIPAVASFEMGLLSSGSADATTSNGRPVPTTTTVPPTTTSRPTTTTTTSPPTTTPPR